ncbi:MAG: hypothetical protein AMJ79_02175 [Phycisphaerae bacterium SM23_30]|nr:MAG: hypothetical protein AMJ79_02175 [Phycisphaerae bacterium SM23_30]
MKKIRNIKKAGLTLTELMVSVMIAFILVGSVGFFLVDSQKSWNRSYNRIYQGVTADGLVARKTFDAVCRKATIKRVDVDDNGQYIELYYHLSPASPEIDQYARFYLSGDELRVDYGPLDKDTFNALSAAKTLTLAQNVKAVNFSVGGAAVQMVLDLDDGKDQNQVTLSSLRHNR